MFTDLERLIRTAWTSFGVQMKANAAATATPTAHPDTDDAFEDAEGDETFVAAAETDAITVATAPLRHLHPHHQPRPNQPNDPSWNNQPCPSFDLY